ncbi:hypothetical protein [Bacillus sp. FJAT-45350]|uniref:hypothetical protein n=1 Tax=Bacillus sp. FJAT-45350 TaxID=2011014 RepID=UPI000BB70D60|nr:hypothetical protein [Bacillus sp. FJAT-45350]
MQTGLKLIFIGLILAFIKGELGSVFMWSSLIGYWLITIGSVFLYQKAVIITSLVMSLSATFTRIFYFYIDNEILHLIHQWEFLFYAIYILLLGILISKLLLNNKEHYDFSHKLYERTISFVKTAFLFFTVLIFIELAVFIGRFSTISIALLAILGLAYFYQFVRWLRLFSKYEQFLSLDNQTKIKEKNHFLFKKTVVALLFLSIAVFGMKDYYTLKVPIVVPLYETTDKQKFQFQIIQSVRNLDPLKSIYITDQEEPLTILNQWTPYKDTWHIANTIVVENTSEKNLESFTLVFNSGRTIITDNINVIRLSATENDLSPYEFRYREEYIESETVKRTYVTHSDIALSHIENPLPSDWAQFTIVNNLGEDLPFEVEKHRSFHLKMTAPDNQNLHYIEYSLPFYLQGSVEGEQAKWMITLERKFQLQNWQRSSFFRLIHNLH